MKTIEIKHQIGDLVYVYDDETDAVMPGYIVQFIARYEPNYFDYRIFDISIEEDDEEVITLCEYRVVTLRSGLGANSVTAKGYLDEQVFSTIEEATKWRNALIEDEANGLRELIDSTIKNGGNIIIK